MRIKIDTKMGGAVIINDDSMGTLISVVGDRGSDGEKASTYLWPEDIERVSNALMGLALINKAG